MENIQSQSPSITDTIFAPPRLEERAPDYVQHALGNPLELSVDVDTLSDLNLPSILESNNSEKEMQGEDSESVLQRVGSRLRDIRDVFRSAPESVKLRWQSKRHLGAAACLSLVTIHQSVENSVGTELANQATGVTGLYMLGGAATYKVIKNGLPNSQRRKQDEADRRQESAEWDKNLTALRSSR